MFDTSMFDIAMVYKMAGIGITTGMLNTLLIKIGKPEIADMLNLTIGLAGFIFVVKMILNGIGCVQQVMNLLG